jgi:hypothetical protein
MFIAKFTNVKFYTGGGKVSRRIRHNQNYRMLIKNEGYTNQELIWYLPYWTEGRVIPSKTTRVKRKNI